MSDAIRQLANDLLRAWNDHDPSRAASFYASNYEGIDVGMAQPQRGAQQRANVLASYVRAFPDLHFTSETLVDGDRAVLVWTMTGTHQGKIMNIPATGRKIEFRGVSVLTIKNGKIVRNLTVWDTAGFLRAIKLLPELSTSP